MEIEITIDDQLLRDAESYTGVADRSELLNEALRALISRQAARELARRGGSEPDLASLPG